ncbi:MAG: sugar porter family MFS transporter [Bacteroidota bacterium]
MKQQNVTYWVITVALAGLLFGFDTIVISGADQALQALWNTSEWFHGTFIMSVALWGTVLGALFGGIPCDKYGRKNTLFVIGLLYLVSALGSGLADSPYVFSFFRFIGGLGVGASSVAAPIYISEIAPAKHRGRFVATYQFNIVFGIFVAFFSNYLLGKYIPHEAWRWMLAVEAIPALVYCLMVVRVPNSPRWLILTKGDLPTAKQILQRINPDVELETQIQSIKQSLQNRDAKFFVDSHKKPILLAFLLAFFNQASGINFILYYAPRIFETAGIDQSNTLIASIPIGAVNLIFTLIGMYLIDRMGRKTLLTIGSIGYIITLLGVSYSFYAGAQGVAVVLFVSLFVGAHAIGQGAVIWVFISEIFPNSVRAQGMSWGSGTHWVLAAIITMVTPAVLKAFSPATIFLFFAIMMVLQLLWALLFMPETKGKKLEELEMELQK